MFVFNCFRVVWFWVMNSTMHHLYLGVNYLVPISKHTSTMVCIRIYILLCRIGLTLFTDSPVFCFPLSAAVSHSHTITGSHTCSFPSISRSYPLPSILTLPHSPPYSWLSHLSKYDNHSVKQYSVMLNMSKQSVNKI